MSAVLTPAPGTVRIQVWDLPVRIVHWSLVVAVALAIATGKLGGEWMPLHGQAGLAIVGLIVFRVAWGFFGSTHARFKSFAPTLTTLRSYLRGTWRGAGHNPLGALSVLALLGVLAFQVGTGLFGNDDIAFTGPLARLVDDALSLRLTHWHHLGSNLLFALLGLHVAAIAFYVKVKKQSLVKPMVTGKKEVPADHPPPRAAGWGAFLVSVLLAASAVYGASAAWTRTPPAPEAAPAAQAAPAW